ncbi:hypothetical protein BGX27_008394 [Mortierella sp. AM989]|nr:hypothetical protein BGX27_008394 [Mortierella sp. AM989]
MIGYDSQNTLVFNFINSTEACDNKKRGKDKEEKADEEEWKENAYDWRRAQWTSLPYPGGAAHQGRRFDTENCFLSSDRKFMVPSYEPDGEGGFSIWDHDLRTWTHVRNDKECSCHEEEVEHGGKFKVKKDKKKLRFKYPTLFAVVYQSYREKGARHGGASLPGVEEAIDTVVIQWKDRNDRNHLTGIQLLNHKVHSCHDIKIGRDVLPPDLTLAASPNNPDHYTFHNTPRKYKSEGDHGSRCENTTLFLFGPNGSGWFNISIADRPSPKPVDILYGHQGDIKGGFHTLPSLEADHPRAVYYGGQLWIFGKNQQGVGVWSIDTSNSKNHYEITAQSQGGPSPGRLTCASCGDGIIVYGGCDRAEDCSTNLRPGERGQIEGNAPVSIYKPGVRNGEDEDSSHESDTSSNSNTSFNSSTDINSNSIPFSSTNGGGGSGSGGSNGSDSGGSNDSGSGGSSGSGSGGSNGSGSGGSNGSDSGGSSNSGSGGSNGSDSGGSNGSGSGGSSDSGSGGSNGSGSGGSNGSGSGGSSDSGSGGSNGSGPDGSNGIPGVIIPNNPYPNPDTSGQVLIGTSQALGPSIAPTTTVVTTSGPVPLPTNGDVPEGAKTSGGQRNLLAILGGILGFLLLLALVSLIFLAAKKRRQEVPDEASGKSDDMERVSPDGVFEGESDMPTLIPVAPPVHGRDPSGPGNPNADGEVIEAGRKRKEPTNTQQEHYEAGHVTHEESSTSSTAKRSSKAKFFMGGGDYKPPLRRPSPTPIASALLITTTGSKTEVEDDSLETVKVVPRDDHTGLIIADVVIAADAAATRHSKDSRIGESSSNTTTTKTTKTIMTTNGTSSTSTTAVKGSKPVVGETEEIMSFDIITGSTETGHNRFKSTNRKNMNIPESSSAIYQGGTTSTSSAISVSHTANGSQTIISSGKTTVGEHIAGGMAMATSAVVVGTAVVGTGSQQSKEQVIVQRQQQLPPTIHKTQITLKLSIIRYERSDAAQATPLAKPGTLMFSQVEMLEGVQDIHIPGSTFSHARDSSKVTGQESGLPSPVVPGPSGAASSTESEPRERALRWMKNESQWKREAAILQHLRSDLYTAELFTLYSLPTFVEYRFVSVMGPFTCTLESYIKGRKGIYSSDQAPTPEEQALALRGPLTNTEIKSMTDSIASAIKWCHDQHIVHLSLTPTSIFLQEFYSEPDGQGGYRTSAYSPYSSKTPGETSSRDSAAPRVEQRWKLWNFSHSRFIGEAVDLSMDMTPYTSPEILVASRHRMQKSSQSTTTTETENPNKDTTVVTTISPEGMVTKTTTAKSSSSGMTVITNQESEKLMASTTMDMWSLGQVVYEMHTSQPMFTSDNDALEKLISVLEKDDEDEVNDLDKAKAHDKIRQQLQAQIKKIEEIQEHGAREVITGLLEMRQERRLDYDEVRSLYLDI